ncbi:hypothetical protein MHU86_6101 [Fragilaria crotonensis]|nr:hypothetical protein MHU86_6101 [Fragilaria crotonensis]
MNATTIRLLDRRQAAQRKRCHLSNAQSGEEEEHLCDSRNTRRRLCPSVVWIQATRDGVLWRGLHPLLFDAPIPVTRRAVQILVRQFRPFIRSGTLLVKGDDDNNDDDDAAAIVTTYRQVPMPTNNESIDIWITPPQLTRIQYTFSGLLIHYEHLWLTLQSLSAWIATLGGGYFLCRHLATAVRMARQQRALALCMCDYDTADRCSQRSLQLHSRGTIPRGTTIDSCRAGIVDAAKGQIDPSDGALGQVIPLPSQASRQVCEREG